jgi:hypothetical protein
MVAHACNPSYSGGRDQEDHSLKPSQANSLRDPISKKPFTEKGWWSSSRCRPCVQTPVPQKRKKNPNLSRKQRNQKQLTECSLEWKSTQILFWEEQKVLYGGKS